MGLLDTIINNVSAHAANRKSYEYTKALQQHQYDLNRKALREFYSNQRFSLTEAGYNPLLGVSGSTAQGFSAGASMSPVMPSSNGALTDEVNAVSSALSARQQRTLQKEQVKSVKEDVEHKKLENEKLRNEIDTSPKTVIGQIIRNGESKTGNSAISYLTTLKNSMGLGFIHPRSFVKTNIARAKNLANSVKSHYSAVSSSKPYQLKAVYNDYKKKIDSYSDIGVWNSKNSYKGHYLNDSDLRNNHSSKYNYDNRPPKSFPSGM